MYFSRSTISRLRRIQTLLNQLDPDTAPQALITPDSPSPQGTIIVFPGSFNPPTFAHLAMLRQARMWARSLPDSVTIYTAFSKRTVDKEGVERPLLLERVHLLQRLLQTRFPHTGILLFNKGLYVDLAQAIRTAYPRVRRIFFLMGYDKIVQILDPRYYDDRDTSLSELFRLAELLVMPRGEGGRLEVSALLQQPQNVCYEHHIYTLPLDTTYREISSSQVRQGNGASKYLVPHEVHHFMRETRAYAPPLRRPDGTQVDVYEERVRTLTQLLARTL